MLNGSPHKEGCTWRALCEIAKELEKQGTQRLHQTLLHTHSIRLDLPAVISGAIISQVYKISLHGLFCVQR